jgi:hypothetical protein
MLVARLQQKTAIWRLARSLLDCPPCSFP